MEICYNDSVNLNDCVARKESLKHEPRFESQWNVHVIINATFSQPRLFAPTLVGMAKRTAKRAVRA